jgi:hypothetical protein
MRLAAVALRALRLLFAARLRAADCFFAGAVLRRLAADLPRPIALRAGRFTAFLAADFFFAAMLASASQRLPERPS